MSKCIITIYGSESADVSVSFEAATVYEALAMKLDYLMQVGGLGTPAAITEQGPPTVKPKSSFLTNLKGGE